MAEPFSLFVSCVEGKPCTRYGSRTFIGAERVPGTNQIQWFPERVVAIPASEHARHRKAYDRLIAAGDLVVRKESEWLAQNDAEAKAANPGAAEAAAPSKRK